MGWEKVPYTDNIYVEELKIRMAELEKIKNYNNGNPPKGTVRQIELHIEMLKKDYIKEYGEEAEIVIEYLEMGLI